MPVFCMIKLIKRSQWYWNVIWTVVSGFKWFVIEKKTYAILCGMSKFISMTHWVYEKLNSKIIYRNLD